MELTEKRRAVFLEELSAHGIVSRAARRASPHATSGAVQTFRDARASDPDFAAAWDSALEEARAAVEYELHRRAVEGWEEPIYGGRYRERVVGTARRYSDRLLELRVKGLLPQYREGSRIALNNFVGPSSGEAVSQFRAALAQMSLADLEELEGIMLRAVELLSGKPAPVSLDLTDDGGGFAMLEHGLGAALQASMIEAPLCSTE